MRIDGYDGKEISTIDTNEIYRFANELKQTKRQLQSNEVKDNTLSRIDVSSSETITSTIAETESFVKAHMTNDKEKSNMQEELPQSHYVALKAHIKQLADEEEKRQALKNISVQEKKADDKENLSHLKRKMNMDMDNSENTSTQEASQNKPFFGIPNSLIRNGKLSYITEKHKELAPKPNSYPIENNYAERAKLEGASDKTKKLLTRNRNSGNDKDER